MTRTVNIGQWCFVYEIGKLERAFLDFYKLQNFVTIYYNKNLILKKAWLGENETILTDLAKKKVTGLC